MSEWKLPPEGGHMDKPSGIYYQTMTKVEVEERLKVNDLIIIPVGSTEAHGDAQPFGEDTLLVTRMAETVAQATGCTVAEPVWYGSHPYHHLGMPGTVVIPEDAFLAYLRAIIAGFWNTGFRKQILLNGHGQEEVIPAALHQFAKKYQVPCVLVSLHWPTVIHDHLKDKEHGGPFETPFRHADEAEASYALALFPEMVKLERAVDTVSEGFMPPGHVDKGGEVYHAPIKGHEQIGFGGIEVVMTPEGVVGKPTLADPSKAEAGLNALFDYMVRLIGDILERFPPGELPPVDKVTMRDPDEIEAVMKGPFHGGKHLYTIAYPP
jgi:creatinine amidohydrolase/Fe(II)-dependent formamide hydrolase-like protein